MEQIREILARAIPIYQQGGMSGAMYREDNPDEADGYAIDINDWKALLDLVGEDGT